MADFDDQAPSPRTYFSSLMDDDDVSSSVLFEPTNENNGAPYSMEMQPQQITPPPGGLLERMTARTGFNAPRLNTESLNKPSDFMQNQEHVTPYLLSPGFSPSFVLDSPIFLSNLVQPSPTTGKYQFPPSINDRDNFFESINALSYPFKPMEENGSSLFLEGPNRIDPSGSGSASGSGLPNQGFPNIEVSVHSETSHLPQNDDLQTGGGNLALVEHSPIDEQEDDDVEQRADVTNGGTAPADDGYNWRKYGQKQVKGSEYPRSYYKCTQPNCPVKKKVERSHEGHITEIIYQSAHNHPKPPPNRRSTVGSSSALIDMQSDSAGDADPAWSRGGVDWKNDNFEVTSSVAGMTGQMMSSDLVPHGGAPFESGGGETIDGSSTEDEDERGIQSALLGYEGEGDESESNKRRKLENYPTEMSGGATRAIREPRVVVQTTSEVDILDDGYRWRKYGQKVVKGNPNPRSYYKCTSTGCNVRKHVERASHDLKSVITTYEGKHNHEVPAARNSSHSVGPTQSSTNMLLGSRHRSEPSQIHNMGGRYERPQPSFGSFNRTGHIGGLQSQGYGYGLGQSFGRAGLGQGKLPASIPIHEFLGESAPLNNMVIRLPKGEPNDEPSSSVYSRMMNRLPLGP